MDKYVLLASKRRVVSVACLVVRRARTNGLHAMNRENSGFVRLRGLVGGGCWDLVKGPARAYAHVAR